jgi:hypothetical protein
VKRLVWLNVLANYVPGCLTLFGFLTLYFIKAIMYLTRKKQPKISPEMDEVIEKDDKDLEKGTEQDIKESREMDLDTDETDELSTQPLSLSGNSEIGAFYKRKIPETSMQPSMHSLKAQKVPEKSMSQSISREPFRIMPETQSKVTPATIAPIVAVTPAPAIVIKHAPTIAVPFTAGPLINNNPSFGAGTSGSPIVFEYAPQAPQKEATSPVDFSPRLAAVRPTDLDQSF